MLWGKSKTNDKNTRFSSLEFFLISSLFSMCFHATRGHRCMQETGGCNVLLDYPEELINILTLEGAVAPFYIWPYLTRKAVMHEKSFVNLLFTYSLFFFRKA